MSTVAGVGELANELAATRGISRAEANSIMKDVVEVMATAIKDGGISIKGVMTIKPKVQKGRCGVIQFGENKGKEYHSADKVVLSIKAGSNMERELNK